MSKKIYYVCGRDESKYYEEEFCDIFFTEEEMLNRVYLCMARSICFDIDFFNYMRKNNQKGVNKIFLDEMLRTFEECIKEQTYYLAGGYKIRWGEKTIN